MSQDQLTYAVEQVAFGDTVAGDRFDRLSLIAETREIAAHPAISPLVGAITVRDGSARLTRYDAFARGQEIVFAPADMPRYVVVHELAHVVHRRSGLADQATHGPAYRACYVSLTGSVYGEWYGRMLRHAFEQAGLAVADVSLPAAPSPVIDVDALAFQGRGIRWE